MNMIKRLILFVVLNISINTVVFTQDTLSVNLSLDNYYNDSLLIAYYYGDRQLVQDTLIVSESDSSFHWHKDTLVEQGMYMAVTLPDRQFVQFLIPEKDQQFSVKLNGLDLSTMKVEGSEENNLFLDYVEFISKQKDRASALQAIKSDPNSTSEQVNLAQENLENIDIEVSAYIKDISDKHPKSITAMILNSNTAIDIPDFEGTQEEVQMKRYVYYKKNYFESIDTKHPAILRTPILDQRINYYLEKLTPNYPDSIKLSVDYLMSLLEPDSESYRYYLSTFLNKYANSKIVGMDAVYVHIADNYYSEEKTPWIDEENLLLIKDNADDIRPVLLGNIAPDLSFYDKEGNPVKISDLDYELLVLLFWAPDCGHCKKTMPEYVEFEKQYRDKNVKIMAVCTKHKEKTKTCWDAIEEKEMGFFTNVADEFHKSRFKIKFNVKTTPKLFILDKDRTILMKNIGADQLAPVIDEFLNQSR